MIAFKLALYSLRHSTAWGWHWKKERDVLSETAQRWKEQFERDEPGVRFVIATRPPRVPANPQPTTENAK